MTFKSLNLPNKINEAVDKLGFENPTPIQESGLPVLIDGRDAILQAQTGSGKTLCFCLPLLELIDPKRDEVQAIVISPTRELAEQTNEVMHSLSTEINTALIIGGVSQAKQESALSKNCSVVIGTPGRILDLIKQKVLRLSRCKYFVLDEADEMLSMGFLTDVRTILSKLPGKRQGVFVSATLTPRVDMLANAFLSSPEQISLSQSGDSAATIKHTYIQVDADVFAKPSLLRDLLETKAPSSTIVFCNTKSDTQMLEVFLRKHGFNARRLNSDLSQKQRSKVMAMIKSGEVDVLIATDIAARGLDLDELELVVNYTVHDDYENYVHRSGRTGRAGKAGEAITFVSARDFGAFHQLQKRTNIEFKEAEPPSGEDLANAKLLKLYKVIRADSDALSEIELLTAKALLDEQSEEDITEVVARLCRAAFKIHETGETKSLEEEIEEESEEPARERRGRRRDDRRDDRRGARDDGDEPRERRSNRDDGDEPRGRRSNRDDGDETRGRRGNRDDGDETRGRRGNRDSRDNKREKGSNSDEARVYVSQGTKDGLNDELLCSLIESLGDVSIDQVSNIRVRPAYSFVTAKPQVADTLIENLNGIDYNDKALTVELAALIDTKPRQRRHHGGGRRQHNNNNRRHRRN